ncbi:BTB/POZ domain-containing protein 6-B-like isoform X3 [Dermacentor andersoni]|uniref:BTB/POZ domain-containing protein 6-B-like isoform X3 n=1 Tax=Dermacentor andersoni TaxID=34620 RepID=UPI002416D621|nr:BTB/POZ domain-containing protein 6-B-like isoform X3 [Dermacentor andersoni]
MPLNLEKFLQSGDHADVEFVVKPEKFDTSKTFKAHKQLLALSSEVFEAMFYGQLPEKDTVVITDLHPDGFYGLLKYVYAGQARIQNCFEALHTNAAAEKYLFKELTSACLDYIRQHVDAKEACLLLNRAFESGYGSLDKVAEAVLYKKGEGVLSSDAFSNSRLEIVHLVLDKAGAMDFKTTIAAFLPKLRFLALSPSDFVEFITSEDAQGVMEKEDAFAILCNVIHKGCADLPEWVCRESSPRCTMFG